MNTQEKMPAKLDDPNWKYIPANATDIKETFKRFGWVGPEEKRKEQNGSH